MATEIKVPTLGESVSEATVARWLKAVGATVAVDDPLVELETDKVTLEVNATAAGTLSQILAPEGSNVGVGAVLGVIGEAGSAVAAAPVAAPAPASAPAATVSSAADVLSPAVRKLVDDNKLDPSKIAASGKDGRLTKEDVQAHLAAKAAPVPAPVAAPAPRPAPPPPPPKPVVPSGPRPRADREERVRMTRLRQRVAERLKEAQNNAAMLTTFNEVDMSNLMALRNRYKDNFEKKHAVRLGFMSFFVKAAIAGLKELPAVNGEIDGTDIVYKNYYDIGVAVGSPQGLVVPVVRDADKLSFAGVEKAINDYGKKARDGKLAIEDLSGGTFTISNGGVYGSLMSTPILNPPQSAILGMHKTFDRPMAIGGKVEIRPMMYLALSYDHRIIDGREAVTFLVRIKEAIEDPQRLLLEV
ncbi:MAG: 2-oxoglutarate dehydrogenase complex dihydrolipoyllysine-residue succinyltransferase [Rhodospirillaceae bacterium]